MKNAIIKEFLAHQETIAKVIETMQEPLIHGIYRDYNLQIMVSQSLN